MEGAGLEPRGGEKSLLIPRVSTKQQGGGMREDHPVQTDLSLSMCEPVWVVLHHLGVTVWGGLGKMVPFSSLLE